MELGKTEEKKGRKRAQFKESPKSGKNLPAVESGSWNRRKKVKNQSSASSAADGEWSAVSTRFSRWGPIVSTPHPANRSRQLREDNCGTGRGFRRRVAGAAGRSATPRDKRRPAAWGSFLPPC